MVNPQLVEEHAVSLSDVKAYIAQMQERGELDFRTNKTREFVENFTILEVKKKDELLKKLNDLKILRLKEPQIIKIMDFLPQTVEDVRVLLQGYPVSVSKKDMERIVGTVKSVA
ncbi:MAG: hypothetical protein CMH61_02650 [Nanoarchaeota archaeon]|nr:hypothetical protein [Nanoarchaeota archaeon]|tara:strand:- start:269 stop:610 length:342 start_codon:yes stop_codon:yes gene_type:complete